MQQIPGAGFTNIVAMGDHLLTGREAVKELESRHHNVARYLTRSLSARRPMMFHHSLSESRQFSVDELAAVLLDVQRNASVAYLQGEVSRATISLPLSLTSLERERLTSAAQSAGFSRINIVPSPAMAAVYWAHCTRVLGTYDARREFLVVDAGCSYTSVSVVRTYCGVSPHHLKVELVESRAIAEGGYAVDLAMSSNLSRASGKVPDILLVSAAEKAKKELSSLNETTFQVKEFNTTVNRHDLEEASVMVMTPLKGLLRAMVMKVPSVSTALLIGGASRMPHLHEFVKSIRLTPDVVDSDYAAVMGAAITAGADLKIEIIDSSHAYEYFACDRANGGICMEIFEKDDSASLCKPDDVWLICQRLRGSVPTAPPTQFDVLQACVMPSSSPTPSATRTDSIVDDEGDGANPVPRAPRFFIPEIPQPEQETVTCNTRGERFMGLKMREMGANVVVDGVEIGSPAARENLVRFKGWFVRSCDDVAVYSADPMPTGDKRTITIVFEPPEDYYMERELSFVGISYGGVVTLNSTGIISGIHTPGDLVMGRDRIESTRKMLKKEKERRTQMKHLGEMRNDLDEAVIRAGELPNLSSLNRICNKSEVCLNLAAELLENVVSIDRRKRKAKLQLQRMGALAKLILHVLDLQQNGKVASERLAHLEVDFERHSYALEAYVSADENAATNSDGTERLKKRSKTFVKTAPTLTRAKRSATIRKRPSLPLGSSIKTLPSQSPERVSHSLARGDAPKMDSPTSPHGAAVRAAAALKMATVTKKPKKGKKGKKGSGTKRGSGDVSTGAWVDSDGSDFCPGLSRPNLAFGDEVDSSSSSCSPQKPRGPAVPRAIKEQSLKRSGQSMRFKDSRDGSLSSSQMSPILSKKETRDAFPAPQFLRNPAIVRGVSPRPTLNSSLSQPRNGSIMRSPNPSMMSKTLPDFSKEVETIPNESFCTLDKEWEVDRETPVNASMHPTVQVPPSPSLTSPSPSQSPSHSQSHSPSHAKMSPVHESVVTPISASQMTPMATSIASPSHVSREGREGRDGTLHVAPMSPVREKHRVSIIEDGVKSPSPRHSPRMKGTETPPAQTVTSPVSVPNVSSPPSEHKGSPLVCSTSPALGPVSPCSVSIDTPKEQCQRSKGSPRFSNKGTPRQNVSESPRITKAPELVLGKPEKAMSPPQVEITASSPNKLSSSRRSSMPGGMSPGASPRAVSPGRPLAESRSLSAASTARRVPPSPRVHHQCGPESVASASTADQDLISPDRRRSLVPRVAGLSGRKISHDDAKSLMSPSSSKQRDSGESAPPPFRGVWAPALKTPSNDPMLLASSGVYEGKVHINTTKVKDDAKTDAMKAIQKSAERFAITKAATDDAEARRKQMRPSEKVSKLLLAKREKRLCTSIGRDEDTALVSPSSERRSPMTPRSNKSFSHSAASLASSTVESPLSSVKGLCTSQGMCTSTHTMDTAFDCLEAPQSSSRGTVPERVKNDTTRRMGKRRQSGSSMRAFEQTDARTDDAVDEESTESRSRTSEVEAFASTFNEPSGRRVVTEPKLVRRKTDDQMSSRVRNRSDVNRTAKKKHSTVSTNGVPCPPATTTLLQNTGDKKEDSARGKPRRATGPVERRRTSGFSPLLGNSLCERESLGERYIAPPPHLRAPLELSHEMNELANTSYVAFFLSSFFWARR